MDLFLDALQGFVIGAIDRLHVKELKPQIRIQHGGGLTRRQPLEGILDLGGEG